MTINRLFARTEARHQRWDETARRNADIRRRIRRGEAADVVARDYGITANNAQVIAGAWMK